MEHSGQGLVGQSEELDETPFENAKNYEIVLSKLITANLKVSANKTKLFLKSVDILGWIWKKGGFLSPSPHTVNALN